MTKGSVREREMINVDRVAELLHVSAVTVHRWCDKGEIESYKLGTGKTSPRRIYLDSVVAYAKRVQKRDIKP